MKKLVQKLGLIAFAAIVMAACGGSSSDSPSAVVKAYYKAAVAEDFMSVVEFMDGSEKATAEEKKQMADFLSAMAKSFGGVKTFEIQGEEISEDGTTATVQCIQTSGKGQTDVKTVKLQKVDGKWKIKL